MAADYARMSDELTHFYDFRDKVVLYIGAAGRQLLDPATTVERLIAIDKNVEDLRELKRKIEDTGLQDHVEVVGADFVDVRVKGDVVYFEFCLHEMDSAEQTLRHAKSLAPDIVVFDHSANSEWTYYGAEEEKVRASSETMERFGIRRREKFQGEQRFANYGELFEKIKSQGAVALERARPWVDARDFVIPMSYELVLL